MKKMFNFIAILPRLQKQMILLFMDIVILVFVLLLSFSLRLDQWYWPNTDLKPLIFGCPVIALPVFIYFGLYKEIIRFIGLNALWVIFKAVSLYSLLWGLVIYMSGVIGVPRSVILINWIIALIFIGGFRMMARWLLLRIVSQHNKNSTRNVIIYGAGSAGRQLLIALKESPEYFPIAFIDDKKEIQYHSINGINVFPVIDLGKLIKNNNISEVLIAIPTISRAKRTKIVELLETYPVAVRSLPSLTKLAQGKIKVTDLLEINVAELLGRAAVAPKKDLLETNIMNQVVLVTGAGGSIGSELCRQIMFLNPIKLILLDLSESSLYIIEQEILAINDANIEIISIIGNVIDLQRMKLIIRKHKVNTIYHAAAYKHVPLVEHNPTQGILNNTVGTMMLAKAAISENVTTFVLISTDKAVRPANVMGATKRSAELVLQALAKEQQSTCFTMVRFGNVLDSSGSVIPLFKKQIKSGGPVTVTHSDVMRYFMTIPEAIELVIQAGAMSKGGEVFVLDMGDPVLIYDLAVKMIKLSGLEIKDEVNPNGDIEIKYTGLRPGEKLFEELLVDGNFESTENKLIMRAEEKMIDWVDLEPILNEIKIAATKAETQKCLKLISQIVPHFEYQSKNLKSL